LIHPYLYPSTLQREDQRRRLLAMLAIAIGIYIYICVENDTKGRESAVERIHHILRYDFYVIDAVTCCEGRFHTEETREGERGKRADLVL
jgi:hypothetical protein